MRGDKKNKGLMIIPSEPKKNKNKKSLVKRIVSFAQKGEYKPLYIYTYTKISELKAWVEYNIEAKRGHEKLAASTLARNFRLSSVLG